MPDHDEPASRAADRAALIIREGREHGLNDSAIAAMILADAMNEVLRLNIGSLVMTVRQVSDRLSDIEDRLAEIRDQAKA